MEIYNYVNKKMEPISADKKNVKMYVCGPTVYNDVHIGNLRPIITFDVLNRLLLELGYKVKFIHNITDIDDKIINKANELNKSENEISKHYENEYFKILKLINIKMKNLFFPRVSDHLLDIENYIQKIIDNNFAYFDEGDVYFKTTKSNLYGMISNKNINELIAGIKSRENYKKNIITDFVLWKKTKTGLNWKTRFSVGRPGWHTECSCLCNKYLGKQIDIHGGGIDLKFPHHENENIQNIAVNNLPLARIWMHVGHLNINDEKMSKSLNNFVLAKDLLTKVDSNTVRWFFFQTHYANPLNFSEDNINNAKKQLNSLLNSLNIFKSYLILENKKIALESFDKSYLDILASDFNFPNWLTFINEKVKLGYEYLKTDNFSKLIGIYFNIFYLLTQILGLQITNIHSRKNIMLLKKWQQLKNEQKYKESDEIRKVLIEKKLI